MSDDIRKQALPPFISPRAYEDCLEYIRQARAHLDSPEATPPPNTQLLVTDPRHGPFTDIRVVSGPGERPLIAFGITDPKATRPRRMDLAPFGALRLGVGLGLRLDLHDNGDGKSYLRVGRGPDALEYVNRVVMDAQQGQHVYATGVFDHRHLIPDAWVLRGEVQLRAEGVSVRSAFFGREAFVQSAIAAFRMNAVAAGLGGTAEAHEAAIRLGFEIGDREHAKRHPQHEADAAE